MARYDVILFDVDDTLLDFGPSQRKAFEACVREVLPVALDRKMLLRARAHYVEVSEALWRELEAGQISMRRLAVQRWELVAERLGLDVEPEVVSARYLELLAREHRVCEGAVALCERLARSHRLAAVTNGYESVQAPRLRAAGLEPHLEFVLTSEAAGVGKPHAAIFERALEQVGDVARSRVLMVGDSLRSDVAGGQGAGLSTCWISRSRTRAATDPNPDHTIVSVAELEAVL